MKPQSLFIDTRVSMYQTCLNVAGGNFAGKNTPVKKVQAYAKELYTWLLKELELADQPIPLPETSTVKQNRKTSQALLKKIKKAKR